MGKPWTTDEARGVCHSLFRQAPIDKPIDEVARTLGHNIGRGGAQRPQAGGFGLSGGKPAAAMPPVLRWVWGLLLRESAKVAVWNGTIPKVRWANWVPTTPGERWAISVLMDHHTNDSTVGKPTVDWVADVLCREREWVVQQCRTYVENHPGGTYRSLVDVGCG